MILNVVNLNKPWQCWQVYRFATWNMCLNNFSLIVLAYRNKMFVEITSCQTTFREYKIILWLIIIAKVLKYII